MPSKPWKIKLSALLLVSSGCINLISLYSLRVIAASAQSQIDRLNIDNQNSPKDELENSSDRLLITNQESTLPWLKTGESTVGFHNPKPSNHWELAGFGDGNRFDVGLRKFPGNNGIIADDFSLGQLPLSSNNEKLISQSPQDSPEQPQEPSPASPQEEPPQLDAQPNKEPSPSSEEIEERLEPVPVDYQQRRTRLLEKLNIPISKLRPSHPQVNRELGELVTRLNQSFSNKNDPPPIEQPQPPKPPKPPRPFGYFRGQVNYFQTDNLFSSQSDRINDGLVFAGLRFVTAPINLGKNTFLTGSVGGNVIRYFHQSEFNYNQFRVTADIFHRFNRQMYGEIGWSNQQLFYARDAGKRYTFQAGDKFLNEHAWHVSIGRRDPLSSKLMLDSYYELRASFADPPENRDRIINTVWLALNYYWQQPLMVGLNYQYYRADFTQRDRDDSYHRLFASLNYRLSDISNLNFQGGYTLGDSTQSNIDFDGWFMSLTYGWELGRF